jgi:hypothetical protein
MAIYVGALGCRCLNVVAVATMGVANFVVADRWVFTRGRVGRGGAVGRVGQVGSAAIEKLAVAVVGICAFSASHRSTRPAAVAAWNQYVAQTEKRLDPAPGAAWPAESTSTIAAEGSSIGVEGGTISEWRGSVFIPHVTLDDVLARLQYPGTAPPQDDVLSSHVMSRGPNSHVFIRPAPRIVTVTSIPSTR